MNDPVDLPSNIHEQYRELPIRRYVDMLRNVVNDYVRKLDTTAAWDQFPGKKMPYAFSKLYGPFGLRATRHTDLTPTVANPVNPTVGFLKLAPLVSPSVPLLPRGTNILTGHDIAFYWSSVDVFGYFSSTWTTDPGLPSYAFPNPFPGPPFIYPPVVQPVDPRPAADIYDPVLEQNGGAIMLQNFSNALNINTYNNDPFGPSPAHPTVTVPHICFDLDLYDRKRGRSLTGDRVPAQLVAGHTYDFKNSFGGREMRFDPDSEIEPRLYLNEVRTTEALDYSDAAYNAASVACWLNIIFKGSIALQES